MKNYAKEINSSESRILDKIDLLKRYGEDASVYEHHLNQIVNSINDRDTYLVSGDYAVARMTNENAYLNTLNELEELESEIDSKQVYLKLFFRNSSLYKEATTNTDFNRKKLVLYVDEAKKLLSELSKIDNINVNDYKKITQDIYSSVYEIIKLELITNCRSELLDYITSNKIGIEYINDIVRKEIEKIKESGSYDNQIENAINEISKDGLDYDYADIELLLIIALKTDDRTIDRLNDKKEDYTNRINKLESQCIDNHIAVSKNKDNMKVYSKKAKNNGVKAIIGSLVLLVNILTFKFAPSTIKKNNTSTTYKSVREAYDTVTDDIRSDEIYISDGEKPYTIVNVYSDVDSKTGKRTVTTYDMSEVNLDNLEEYTRAIEDNNKGTSSTIDYRLGSQLSSDEYTTVERMTYEDEKVEFDEVQYTKEVNKLRTVLFAIITTFGVATFVETLLAILNTRKKIAASNEIDSLDNTNTSNNDRIKEYKKLKNEINDLINQIENKEATTKDYKKMILK